MKTGTKSLLWGCHQFILHPLFVYIAWIKLYKKRPNWKEALCIFVHDWGYWGVEKMESKEGDNHPEWAAIKVWDMLEENYYSYLCLYHSRFYSERADCQPSKLCWADKIGTALYPVWLWVVMAWLSGEGEEYMHERKYDSIMGDKKERDTLPSFFKRYRKVVLEKWSKMGDVV